MTPTGGVGRGWVGAGASGGSLGGEGGGERGSGFVVLCTKRCRVGERDRLYMLPCRSAAILYRPTSCGGGRPVFAQGPLPFTLVAAAFPSFCLNPFPTPTILLLIT